MFVPVPFYGILIAIGLTETLTFVSGFAIGPVAGFVTGSSIIVISDMATLPGAWTPFIALIIGGLGVIAGVIRIFVKEPNFRVMVGCAVCLTLVSETLQNAWLAVFYNLPFLMTMLTGLITLVAALVNNVVLFPTVGLRTIRVISSIHYNGNNGVKS